MDINQKKRAINRWKKVFEKESKIIAMNSLKYPHLKARIFKYLMGDGSVTMPVESDGTIHYSIAFYPDDEVMLESFLFAFEKVYDRIPTVKRYNHYFCVRIDSKSITLDLLNYGSFRSLEWQIPANILKSKLTGKEWIRAFYDSEGYVGKRSIVVQSVNYGGLTQVKELLQSYGIDCKMYT